MRDRQEDMTAKMPLGSGMLLLRREQGRLKAYDELPSTVESVHFRTVGGEVGIPSVESLLLTIKEQALDPQQLARMYAEELALLLCALVGGGLVVVPSWRSARLEELYNIDIDASTPRLDGSQFSFLSYKPNPSDPFPPIYSHAFDLSVGDHHAQVAAESQMYPRIRRTLHMDDLTISLIQERAHAPGIARVATDSASKEARTPQELVRILQEPATTIGSMAGREILLAQIAAGVSGTGTVVYPSWRFAWIEEDYSADLLRWQPLFRGMILQFLVCYAEKSVGGGTGNTFQEYSLDFAACSVEGRHIGAEQLRT